MSKDASKICPYCAEQISAAAKVCPRCRQWLSVFSLRNPAASAAVICLGVLVCVVGFLMFMQRLFYEGVDFSPYRNDISIVESHMSLKATSNEKSVHLVVVITNQTDIAWKQIQMDVRFFNKAGKLIDAPQGFEYNPVLPHTESAFRMDFGPNEPLSDYDSYKIEVKYARDAHSRFNN